VIRVIRGCPLTEIFNHEWHELTRMTSTMTRRFRFDLSGDPFMPAILRWGRAGEKLEVRKRPFLWSSQIELFAQLQFTVTERRGRV
jgi:hypothetical protein